MEDNLFAAFSFSKALRKPSPGVAGHASKIVHNKKGGDVNASNFLSEEAAASHAAVPAFRIERGKVQDADEASGFVSGSLNFSSEMVSLEDGGNSINAPVILNFESHYPPVANTEKTEVAVGKVPRRALSQSTCVVQVKEEETKGSVGSLSVGNKKKRRSKGNGERDEELCGELEDFGGGDGLNADSVVLEVKKVNMKKQSPKGSKFGSAEVRPPPQNWEEAIQSIRTIRTGRDAPVDLLGPAQLVDPNADSETQRFHVLVAAMISSQTRDAVTAAAVKRLHALPGGLTVMHLAESDVSMEKLEELLKPVGFYRVKAKQLKSLAEILLKPPHRGRVPRTLDELMKLPGVGPKVGLLVLWVGFGMGEIGFIVDSNVRRVCCRLGWAPEDSSAEKVRQELESWLPKDLWAEASTLLVGFGQQICKPIGPNCKECQLQNSCPSAFKCAKKVFTKKMQS